MKYPILKLKPGKDAHVKNRHHSIFQNAIAIFPDVKDGSIVQVVSSRDEFVGYAMLNRKAYISARSISFEEGDPLAVMKRNIEQAIAMRKELMQKEDTNAIRLINAEGDGIPGLIVDQYNDVLAVQFTTLGMDLQKEWVIDVLEKMIKPKAIFEKSSGSARKKEGLPDREGWLKGTAKEPIEIRERGITFLISLTGSQKTGLFLDQREMRSLVRSYSEGKTVLDCCSYVGGFSVSALLGGAKAADAVDYDKAAIERAKEHVKVNKIDPSIFGSYAEDVFQFLRRKPIPRPYDFIILDPPAFAKRSSDLEQARRAYTDLNRMALELLAPGGLLLTCSCSYQVDEQLFQTILFHAARQAKKSVKILQKHRHAVDHPINLYHPEVDYLKSLFVWVE
jgi:23S rRNA (cytosine1962-C5)-methyltransferase